MRPFTAQFAASLRGNHLVASRCDLYFPGSSTPVTVPIEGGTVTNDRTAQVRRSGTVQIPWSLQAGQDLGIDLRTLPLGGTVQLWRGLRYPDRTIELMSLGLYRCESVAWRTSDDSATLELADRMAQVRDEQFTAPYTPSLVTPITRAATLTDDSPVVAVTPTSDLIAGMTVTGPGLLAGTKIQTINSSSQITLTLPANIKVVKRSTWPGRQYGTRIFWVDDTSDLAVGMVFGPQAWSFIAGYKVSQIDSPTSARGDYPDPYSAHFAGGVINALEYTLPAAQTLTFGGSVRISRAAVEIVQAVYGATINYSVLYDPVIVLGDVFYTGSRADAVHELALAAAAETYFDGEGNYVFDQPAGTLDPVWTVDTGQNGVMISADESLSRTGVFNGVLVQGQNTATDAPVSSLVVDNDASSPTVWGGPFGKVARIEQSAAVQTTQQATDAATAILNRRLTLQRAITVTQAPNPALEAGDVVVVVFPDGRQETHLVNSVTVDLGPAASQTLVLQATTTGLTHRFDRPSRRVGVHTGAAAWRELEHAQVLA
jgi:hypothetical protein